MIKYIKSFLLFLILFLSGCGTHDSNLSPTYNHPKKVHNNINTNYEYSTFFKFFDDVEYTDLNKAVIEIAQQLLLNITRSNQINNKIAVTSLVCLDQFKETSSFGRTISESLINELHERRFKVIDYRARPIVTVNPNGEFILSRDADNLKDEIPHALMLVGTYSIFEYDTKCVDQCENNYDKVVINTRIMDIETQDVVSTSRVIVMIKNAKCKLCGDCKNKIHVPIKQGCSPFDSCDKKSDNKIFIVDDEIDSSANFNKLYMTDDK